MNILMLTEYFYPFAHGGTEWSVYHLITGLQKKGINCIVATPNYGAQRFEVWNNISIKRFPFLRKISKSNPSSLSPFWLNNIVWWIISFLAVYQITRKEQIDLLHVQGKSFIPAALFTKWILRKPVIITFRDYQTLCPFGLCLTRERNYKRCTFTYFMTKEIFDYYDVYIQRKGILSFITLLFTGFRSRIISSFLRFFLAYANKLICISEKEQYIFAENGITQTKVIYNMMPFVRRAQKSSLSKAILFVGRLTPGKGADLYVESSIALLQEKIISKSFVIGEGFLKKTLVSKVKQKKQKNIIFLSQISYTKTLQYIKKSALVVIPSRWEEPFGRVALEALSLGVPVVVSKRGGLPEIVNSLPVGIIVEPTLISLQKGIKNGFVKNISFRKNIKKYYSLLQNKFCEHPIRQYLNIYEAVI